MENPQDSLGCPEGRGKKGPWKSRVTERVICSWLNQLGEWVISAWLNQGPGGFSLLGALGCLLKVDLISCL